MPVFIAVLLMQYVISVKAGLVNHVQGTANVAVLETARVGHPIKTGANGYVEILLRPGSFLRLGENSEATIDDADLAKVKLTVSKGPALIEVVEINKDYPITVTTGNLTMRVIDSGIYRFEDGSATVMQGKLQTGDLKLTYPKGWQVFFQDNYRARKTGKAEETSLDVYSETRSGAVAGANFAILSSLSTSNNSWSNDSWLYYPNLRLYTFIPRSDYRSPYGYKYYGAVYGRVDRYAGNNNSNPGSSDSSSAPRDNSNNNNGGNTTAAAPAPAPIVNTPSGQQSTPATYIDSKASPVGATAR